MKKFKTILAFAILIAAVAFMTYSEIEARERRKELSESTPAKERVILLGDDNISFESIDGVRVRTYFSQEKIELPAGTHTIKVSYKKSKFWLLFTQEVTSEFVFEDIEFFAGEKLTITGKLNEEEDVVYFSLEDNGNTVYR